MGYAEHLGDVADGVDRALERIEAERVVERLWAGDHTAWQDDPTEVADRLGWLSAPEEATEHVERLHDLTDDVVAAGSTHVMVAGMGGSSLFADVIARVFPARDLTLHVLDSTDPAAIRRAAALAPLERLLVVVASKSGTTLETRSHLSWFWERTSGRGEQFLAITDPGTELAELGRERGFRHVFENRPDIGGRYSALSFFGLVPAALAGVDVGALIDGALAMAGRCSPNAADNPGARLGAILGGATLAGRDKLTLVLPPEVAPFADWVEQLVAESTGKDGTGILPVVGEPVDVSAYGDDRLLVTTEDHPDADALAASGHPTVVLPAFGPLDLGAEAFRWELATAVAGAILGVNPFDQPDVAAAKQATARVLADGPGREPVVALRQLLDPVRPGGYLALLAFVDPGGPLMEELGRVRVGLRDRTGVATTLGVGPRYLHSTGQLHKGGPDGGVFVQIVGSDHEELPIPGEPFGFSTLKRAQADGDLDALRRRGAQVGRVPVEELLAAG